MQSWKRWVFVCALGGVTLLGCDDNTNPGTDAGPRPDGSTQNDGSTPQCPDEVAVSGEITEDTTWDCPAYVISGHVFVVDDSTLTIAPGTTIYGDTASSEAAALIVTRGSQLNAVGTAEEPIVFTSGNPVGARASGDWAGVVLLGAATTNDGNCVSDADPSTEACDAPGYLEDRIEGIPTGDVRALYGGTDDASSCGTLRYVRIEFAGRELSPDNELNGLSVGACGSGTDVSYLQVHRGKDDGIELFGGTTSMHHIVITGASDDSLDMDEGWRGNVQFMIVHQYPGFGDRGIEADNLGANEGATPRTRPSIWNATFIGTDQNQAMLLREGMEGLMHNLVLESYGQPPDVQGRQVDPSTFWPGDLVMENSFFHDVADFPVEDMSADEVYALARTMDPTLPATRPDGDAGLSAAQKSLLSDLEREHLDDDMGFDEGAAFAAAERHNHFDVDPGIGSASTTAPSYVPSNDALNGQATPAFNSFAPGGFGDTSATYAGAIAPNGTDWTAGWTAYPES